MLCAAWLEHSPEAEHQHVPTQTSIICSLAGGPSTSLRNMLGSPHLLAWQYCASDDPYHDGSDRGYKEAHSR